MLLDEWRCRGNSRNSSDEAWVTGLQLADPLRDLLRRVLDLDAVPVVDDVDHTLATGAGIHGRFEMNQTAPVRKSYTPNGERYGCAGRRITTWPSASLSRSSTQAFLRCLDPPWRSPRLTAPRHSSTNARGQGEEASDQVQTGCRSHARQQKPGSWRPSSIAIRTSGRVFSPGAVQQNDSSGSTRTTSPSTSRAKTSPRSSSR